MHIADRELIEAFRELEVEHRGAERLAGCTSLGIGGTTDLLIVRERRHLPELLRLLRSHGIRHRLLGGGTNLLVGDGELPWVALRIARTEQSVRIDGQSVWVDAAEDLGRAITTCAKANLGGMEGLVGVPGTVGGALRMNAGAYGTEMGKLVREVVVYRALFGRIDALPIDSVRFEYRRASFSPCDILLGARLELPERPYREIVDRIHVFNFKRRSSQPLTERSAGCIFKNPVGSSAGSLIDGLGLKGLRVGGAMVSERHANFFVNRNRATCADMYRLMEEVRNRVWLAFRIELQEEIVLWVN
ncbi:MAG TPA: UDP-N-acetylmuramate dehydrogenase [Candidatus Dormibacteraeota bacterium]|nr:UDP-N-acetylmuramate dehydrogenase [Candidatus Dormibacteraeota bacterium]